MNTQTQSTEISFYALGVLEDYPHLHFIAFNDTQLLAYNEKTGKAHFFYEVNEDLSFHFNMLCEVGAPYQAWFEQMIKDLHFNLGTKETETDYFNTLIPA